jgi:hypothetical protein
MARAQTAGRPRRLAQVTAGRTPQPSTVWLPSGMPHPIMFDEADPLLGRLRALALAFPDAAEKISHGHPAFFTTKVFAYYGGSVKVDGVYRQHKHSVLVLVDPDERAALLEEARCFVPAYLGSSGWIGVDLTGDTDWDEVDELLDASYRRTAGSRRVALLDSRRSRA